MTLSIIGSEAYIPSVPNSTLEKAVLEKADIAFTRFNRELTDILTGRASDYASGTSAVNSGRVSGDQEDDLQKSLENLLLNTPLRYFSPKIVANFNDYLKTAGFAEIRNYEGKTLRESSRVAGDFAKGITNNIKDESPEVYYGVALALIAGLGTRLPSGRNILRLKKTMKFAGLRFEVEPSWGPLLKEPYLSFGVSKEFNDIKIKSNVHLDTSGEFTEADLNARYNFGEVDVFMTNTFEDLNEKEMKRTSVLGVRNHREDTDYGAFSFLDNGTFSAIYTDSYDRNEDGFTLEYKKELDERTDVAAYGRYNHKTGESFIGFGLKKEW